jgi:hypothetical protein
VSAVFANAEGSIFAPGGMTIEQSRTQSEKTLSSIRRSLERSSNFMATRWRQDQNQERARNATEAGMQIERSDSARVSAHSLIPWSFDPDSNVIEAREMQAEKQRQPRHSTEAGIQIDFREKQRESSMTQNIEAGMFAQNARENDQKDENDDFPHRPQSE